MKAQLVSITQPHIDGIKTPEELIVYCARVSNPSNQLNLETAPKLLAYLIRNKHHSPFEMVDMCVEIETSRAIAAQILRHWSFSFQEFSLRYAESACQFEPQECRMKGSSNRQGSIEADKDTSDFWDRIYQNTCEYASDWYQQAIEEGIAPEVARMLLPLGLTTRLYMKGSVRDWIFYLQTRTDNHAQKEHRMLALEIKKIFDAQFPNIAKALEEI